MPLQFPNTSRVFDPVRRSVTFWGHDSAFEVAFHLDADALNRFSPQSGQDEAASLRTFDTNRLRIECVASGVYARRRQNFYRLSASDF
ncbi:DUF1488 domain-containing protein [Xanthobacter tagetidis]|jgi:hypothetical protein|uniref:DUF1488 domain-containing protein n=1 Tax=Xanthobacter tagetidis TaxID=60216 RepID=A0A3L7ALI2_9HYPH|nr:DUF1488 domain-containing protein [Xanthobacter tagetidis]MBB6309093.1 hypothetical protein [Xanthobacter tagetidis]RLP80418.1 DUF1488 domain-containing protein [Xanthobacter tagetidis]